MRVPRRTLSAPEIITVHSQNITRRFLLPLGIFLLGAVLLLSLSGCETTGDPRRGGLFGWSESKAIERQNRLRDQLAASSARERSLREGEDLLSQRRAELETQVAVREEQVRQLQGQLAMLREGLALGSLTPREAGQQAEALRQPVQRATGPGAAELRRDFAEIDRQINLLNQ